MNVRKQRIGLKNTICTVVILFLILTFGISLKASAGVMSCRTGIYCNAKRPNLYNISPKIDFGTKTKVDYSAGKLDKLAKGI